MNLNEFYNVTERRPTYLWNKKGVMIIDWTFEYLFETKEEYLAFVAEWKDQYRELSKRCKKAKMDLRNGMREGNVKWHAHEHVASLKQQATMMLELRRQGKLAAAEQMRAQMVDKEAATC